MMFNVMLQKVRRKNWWNILYSCFDWRTGSISERVFHKVFILHPKVKYFPTIDLTSFLTDFYNDLIASS